MKRAVFLLLIVVTTSLISAEPAQAVVISAQTFAEEAAFCGDAVHTVVGSLVVKGSGPEFFATGCAITMSDRAKLKLDGATLAGPGVFDLKGGMGARVELKGASLAMGGHVLIDPGCCGPEGSKARVKITETFVQSNTGMVLISASPYADRGRVEILKGSTIVAGNDAGDNITVQASDVSLDADRGRATVMDSTLNAGGQDILILTRMGKTKVLDNTLTYGTAFVTAIGGTCLSEGNTPSNPACTP